ncbi:unnamed protein product [Closterium sp. NIES-64]|nr:unnamed protein product [Closterium sp. NIES-64]
MLAPSPSFIPSPHRSSPLLTLPLTLPLPTPPRNFPPRYSPFLFPAPPPAATLPLAVPPHAPGPSVISYSPHSSPCHSVHHVTTHLLLSLSVPHPIPLMHQYLWLVLYSHDSGVSSTGIVAIVGAVAAVMLLAAVVWWRWGGQKQQPARTSSSSSLSRSAKRRVIPTREFSPDELCRATGQQQLSGGGGLASERAAVLVLLSFAAAASSHAVAAITCALAHDHQLSLTHLPASPSHSIAQMSPRSHPNVARLLGYCKAPPLDGSPGARMEQILVYEMLPNGGLDEWIGECECLDSTQEMTVGMPCAGMEQILVYEVLPNGGLDDWIGECEWRQLLVTTAFLLFVIIPSSPFSLLPTLPLSCSPPSPFPLPPFSPSPVPPLLPPPLPPFPHLLPLRLCSVSTPSSSPLCFDCATPLTLLQRLHILLGAAKGLAYLHKFGIVHRDIKPANILLDRNMQAKVANLGMVRVGESSVVSFTDPCYAQTMQASTACDVYSFGAVILATVASHAALLEDEFQTDTLQAVTNCLSSGDAASLKDPRMDAPDDMFAHIIQLALSCCLANASLRPAMPLVVKELKDLRGELLGTGSVNGSMNSDIQQRLAAVLAECQRQWGATFPGWTAGGNCADAFALVCDSDGMIVKMEVEKYGTDGASLGSIPHVLSNLSRLSVL